MGLFSYIKDTFSISREEVDPMNSNSALIQELTEAGVEQSRLYRRNGESATQQSERLQAIKDKRAIARLTQERMESAPDDNVNVSGITTYTPSTPPLGFNLGKDRHVSELEDEAARQARIMRKLLGTTPTSRPTKPSIKSHSPTAARKQLAHEARIAKIVKDSVERSSNVKLQYYTLEEYVEMLNNPPIVRSVQVLFDDLPNEVSLRLEYMDNLHQVDSSILIDAREELLRITKYARIDGCKRIVITYVKKEVVE